MEFHFGSTPPVKSCKIASLSSTSRAKHCVVYFLLNFVLLLSIPKSDLLIILFPVLRIDADTLGENEKLFLMKLFCQRPWTARNNSISCLDDSISCSEYSIWTPQVKYQTFCKIRFSIPALKIGYIILFTVVNFKII